MAIHRYERHNNKKVGITGHRMSLINYLDTVNDRLDYDCVVVSYWTGIRIGELLALTYRGYQFGR